nr:MAG TPA: hypothetical protein [Bacteriophage sp.]
MIYKSNQGPLLFLLIFYFLNKDLLAKLLPIYHLIQ